MNMDVRRIRRIKRIINKLQLTETLIDDLIYNKLLNEEDCSNILKEIKEIEFDLTEEILKEIK